ncbi:MAG: hypothetical protein H6722_09000 [Sandaracinus sp.]|nr:hypothetical protein [Sandaracinus sp.]
MIDATLARGVQALNRLLERGRERLEAEHLRGGVERVQTATKLLAGTRGGRGRDQERDRPLQLLRLAGQSVDEATSRDAERGAGFLSHRAGLYRDGHALYATSMRLGDVRVARPSTPSIAG